MTPPDIRKAAEAVIDRGYNEGMVEALERALMNERERCAMVAERIAAAYGEDETGWIDCCETVAAAIRRGDNPDA